MKLKIIIAALFLLLFTTPVLAITDIWLEAKPLAEMKEVSFACKSFTSPTLKVYLSKNPIPTGKVYFYSVIYYNDLLGTAQYIARADILNRYVFIPYLPGEPIRAQFYGTGFIPLFSAWEDTSFYYVFKGKTCAQLKSYHFVYGFSTMPDLSDFKGAAFRIE